MKSAEGKATFIKNSAVSCWFCASSVQFSTRQLIQNSRSWVDLTGAAVAPEDFWGPVAAKDFWEPVAATNFWEPVRSREAKKSAKLPGARSSSVSDGPAVPEGLEQPREAIVHTASPAQQTLYPSTIPTSTPPAPPASSLFTPLKPTHPSLSIVYSLSDTASQRGEGRA